MDKDPWPPILKGKYSTGGIQTSSLLICVRFRVISGIPSFTSNTDLAEDVGIEDT